ncbi:MAG TPA: HAMP domain-containing sensor histidine kinase [Actinocrinis sp.]
MSRRPGARPRRRLSLDRLSLRGRFALLAAVAVSVAVIGAALACYFLVQNRLYAQIDNQLAMSDQHGPPAPGAQPGQGEGTGAHPGGGAPPGAPSGADMLAECQQRRMAYGGFGGMVTEVVRASDSAACRSDTAATIAPTQTQLAVAEGTESGQFYDSYIGGTHFRVYTFSPGRGYSVSHFLPLTSTDQDLSELVTGLAVAAAAGIALASVAGLALARSAVRPVKRLTRAVEHVARTEDLSVRLPVEGRDEINRLGAAFNSMTGALAQSRNRQRQLIADAGHELRTPLTSLRTNIDLLLRSERTGRPLPDGRREAMLESVDQQLHELSGLVADLLELSRGQEGGARRATRVALHEGVARAVARARLRGPGLEFDVAIEPWFVRGDQTALDRAVVNLLDNAVKFSPPGGTVTVRLAGGRYRVRDRGPGIDPADLPHVFERFWRADSARSLPGSGLGLAIVAQVAHECGGSITLEPAPGGGTLAALTLPGDPGRTGPRPGAGGRAADDGH